MSEHPHRSAETFYPIFEMPKDKSESVAENVFKLSILVPVIHYLEVFMDTRHNLSPDEFLKAIYAPEKPKSERCSRTTHNSDLCTVNPPEHLPEKLQIPPIPLQKSIAQLFFEIIRLKPFLTNIAQEFRKRRNRRCLINMSRIITISYALIYRTSIILISDTINCLIYFDVPKMLALLSFLLTPKLASWFYIAGCEVYDLDFVEQKIRKPFVKALPVLQIIYKNLLNTRRQKPVAKKVTIPIQMNVLTHPKRFPPPPVCTPEKVLKISVQPVPKTLYKMPEIESKIAMLRQKNRLQAAQRLEIANSKAPACFETKKSKRYQKVLDEIVETRSKNRLPIVARKIPTFKSVPVKKTITTILREGALIANSEVKEIEKLKELMKGSFNPADIQRTEDETKQNEKGENLRKIVEKHLSCFINHEKSVLAEQQLLQEAQRFFQRLEEIEECKRINKISHGAQTAAENAGMPENARKMKLHLIKMREKALRRKLQFLQRMQTAWVLRDVPTKKYEPMEAMKLGLNKASRGNLFL